MGISGAWNSLLRRRRSTTAAPETHSVEIWHVRYANPPRRDRDQYVPYFIASCSCEWVSEAHDAADPRAEERARADARGHSPQVAEGITYPLD
ncbi:hypothetical protein ACWDR0_02780 [Streptomyces sp. NPDC003691]